MQKMNAGDAASRPTWETLETFARTHIQGFIQQLLEDEVSELLGWRSRHAAPRLMRRRARATDTGSRDSWR